MRVVALFRVSTERQATEGASLDAQERIFDDLARLHRWDVVEKFRGCESASQAGSERQVLQSVLACVRSRQPDAIYVHEQSRLTRGDELEVALLMRELRERGLKVIVGGVVRDLASIDERFMIGIQSLVDRTESERIRERVNRGKQQLSLEGRKNTGRSPYGYRNPPPGDPKRGILQIVEEQAAVVRRIFQMSASGTGMARIAMLLSAEGVPSPLGKSWSEGQVRAMISNPVYIGTHCGRVWVPNVDGVTQRRILDNPRAIVVPNAHEPIVDQAVWNIIHSRRNPPTSKPTLLTGLLTLNGGKASSAKQKDFNGYYVRSSHGYPWIHREKLETAVWNSLVSVIATPETIEACVAAAEDDRDIAELRFREQQSVSTVEKLKRKLDRLVDMRAEGELSRDEFAARSKEVKETLLAAEAAQQTIAAELAGSNPDQLRQIVNAARIAVAPGKVIPVELRRPFLLSLIRRVHVFAERRVERRAKTPDGKYAAKPFVHWDITRIEFEFGPGPPSRRAHSLTSSP